jgi:hypothetical protein
MPPLPTKKKSKTHLTENSIVSTLPISGDVQRSNDQEDSRPLDFDTFVPSHNPSLDFPLPPHPPSPLGPDYVSYSPPAGPIVDEDEAFTRALGAMYWGGYWTAVYHVIYDFYTLPCESLLFSHSAKDLENSQGTKRLHSKLLMTRLTLMSKPLMKKARM